jgi:hypothetical protein
MIGDKSHQSSAKMISFTQGGTNYVNCSNFKIANETDDYYKIADEEKDYRQMIISTPPSNMNKQSKFGIIVNSI